MENQEFAGVMVILIGLVQVLKNLGLPSKFAPLASVLLGVLCSVLLGDLSDMRKVILVGIVAGLSTSGLYSNLKPPINAAIKRLTG